MKRLLCLILVLSGCSVIEKDQPNDLRKIANIEHKPEKFRLDKPKNHIDDFPEKSVHCIDNSIEEELARMKHKISWCYTEARPPIVQESGSGYKIIVHKYESETYTNRWTNDLATREKKTHRFNIYLNKTPSCKSEYTIEKIPYPNLKVSSREKTTHEFKVMRKIVLKRDKFDCS